MPKVVTVSEAEKVLRSIWAEDVKIVPDIPDIDRSKREDTIHASDKDSGKIRDKKE